MTLTKSIFYLVMALNIAWFGMAFHYFALKAESAARMLIPRAQRDSPLFATQVYSVRFLGGMNFAFALVALLLLVNPAGFSDTQLAWLVLMLAVAHASQFVFNLPMALGRSRLPWVDKAGLVGPMKMIFTIDGVLMVANAALCALLFAAPH